MKKEESKTHEKSESKSFEAKEKKRFGKSAAKSIVKNQIERDQMRGTMPKMKIDYKSVSPLNMAKSAVKNKMGKMPKAMHGKELLKKAMGVFK